MQVQYLENSNNLIYLGNLSYLYSSPLEISLDT